jgi:chromosome partitioning protein
MATQEPDRGARRRWFRLPGQQHDPKEALPEEPQSQLSNDPVLAESTPTPLGEVEEIPAPSSEALAPVPATDPTAAALPEPPVVAPPEPPVVTPPGPAVAAAPDPPSAADPRPVPADAVAVEEQVRAEPAGSETGPAETAAPEPAAEPGIELPRVISIANQKGGVGKTTTAVNLGAALAEMGFRVLVVDLDPQGNATTGLGISHRNVEGSIYDVIMNDTPVDDCVEPTSVKNLFVCPATIDLAGAEIELVPAFSRELKLKRALQSARDDYDFTLIDCPPSLGLLTVNGLAASDDVLVPIQCEYYALEGLGQLLRNVALVKSNLNPDLDVRGIVLTMYDARTRLAVQVEREVREHFGAKVYRTVVPRTVRISEAPSFGEPIIVFDATSRGAVAYRELAKEVSRGATRRAG